MGESVTSKHTPGPWKIFDGWGSSKFAPVVVDCIPDDNGKFVGNCICHLASTNENAVGNARLIAAAPELLDAVERLLIGAAACAIPHPKEREVLQMAVDFAIQAKRKAKGGA